MTNLIKVTWGSGRVSKEEHPDWNLTTENPVIYNEALKDAGTDELNIGPISSVIPTGTDVIKERVNMSRIYEGHVLITVQSIAYSQKKGEKAVAGLGWKLSEDKAGRFVEVQGKNEKDVEYSINLSLEKIVENKIKDYPYTDMVISSITCESDEELVCALVQAIYNIKDVFTEQLIKEPTLEETVEFNNGRVFENENKIGMSSLFARKEFYAGEIVMKGYGDYIKHQNYDNSIQVDKDKHIKPISLNGRILRHSCNPNLFLNTDFFGMPVFLALKDITKGEEINYHYAMSEFIFRKNTFEKNSSCYCGNVNCAGKILGFSELDPETKKRFLDKRIISTYLLNLN